MINRNCSYCQMPDSNFLNKHYLKAFNIMYWICSYCEKENCFRYSYTNTATNSDIFKNDVEISIVK